MWKLLVVIDSYPVYNGYVVGRFGKGGTRIIRRATKEEIKIGHTL